MMTHQTVTVASMSHFVHSRLHFDNCSSSFIFLTLVRSFLIRRMTECADREAAKFFSSELDCWQDSWHEVESCRINYIKLLL